MSFLVLDIFEKLYLVRLCLFFDGWPFFFLQDIKISSKYIDFYAKISLILYTPLKTQQPNGPYYGTIKTGQ